MIGQLMDMPFFSAFAVHPDTDPEWQICLDFLPLAILLSELNDDVKNRILQDI
jgi:hypothetical protein